jgi:hypothetical protein
VYLHWMTTRRGIAIASVAVAAAVAVTLPPTVTSAATPATSGAKTRERPRGAVEDCSTTPGWGRRDEFTRRQNLIVGPLAVERAGNVLAYADSFGGNKIFVYVRGGRRVTLELSPRTREHVGLVFGPYPDNNASFRNARRVVSFIACRRGELPAGRFDGWPVTSWVGFLLATSPRCVPLLVWVDDQPSPRRAVIRFGVPDCG